MWYFRSDVTVDATASRLTLERIDGDSEENKLFSKTVVSWFVPPTFAERGGGRIFFEIDQAGGLRKSQKSWKGWPG